MGEAGVSVGVDAVRSGPVTPDGSSEPEAAGGAVVAVGRGASVAVGASPDTGVDGVRVGEAGVSVGVDAVRSGPVTPDGSSEPEAAGGAVVAVGRGAVAVGASPDTGVDGVRVGEAGVSVGVDAVRSGPVTPEEPQAASAAVTRTTLNRVTYLVVGVRVVFFPSRS